MTRLTFAMLLLGFLLCLSSPLLGQDSYIIRLDGFHIDNTRSLHEDTDMASLAVKIGESALEPSPLTWGKYDVNNGDHTVGLQFGPVVVATPETPVLINYQILNAGHTDQNMVKDWISKGTKGLIGAELGTGNIWAAAATEAVEKLLGVVFADCDGPVAIDQISVTGAILKQMTANNTTHVETRFYAGHDSPDGCGSNSKYKVTFSVIPTSKKVFGAIGDKWADLNRERGPLGPVITDESDALAGGRFNNFQNGFIYWSQKTGAHAVYGAIGEKWTELGKEGGALGYPLSDETAEGSGRCNRFQNGYICWSPQTGAHGVYGAIGQKWGELGGAKGSLGFPTSDEMPDGAGRISHFQKGYIYWTPQTGAQLNRKN